MIIKIPAVDPAAVLAAERANMVCTRAQGKIAIGAEVWAKVTDLVNAPTTPWALSVIISDATEWHRLNPNMDTLAWAMGLTATQTDELFRKAVLI